MLTKKGMERWVEKRNKEIDRTNEILKEMGAKFRFKKL